MNILDYANGVEKLVDPMEVGKVLYMQTLSDSLGQRTHYGSEEKLRAAVEKVSFSEDSDFGRKIMTKKKVSLKMIWRDYMGDGFKMERWRWIGILMLVAVFAGFFGWVYEFIFYFFDGGTGEFYMQGGNFLPWINIYAIGAVLIVLSCWKLRKYPWAVFLFAMVVAGIVEFIGGWLVYTIGNGTRYWDYNTEILNFGNIGGFVCLRSVLFFGVSALFLMYAVVPVFVWLSRKMSRRAFMILAIVLFAVVMMDEVYNLLASKVFGWFDAMEFYRGLGWKYLT